MINERIEIWKKERVSLSGSTWFYTGDVQLYS